MGPLIPNGVIASGWDFVIAILIGLVFGFILEASGFSSSRNIAGVFYGYNFVVLRVFFTAVIVANVGFLYLDYFGWLDLSKVYVLPTYFGPMLLGSIIMGLGFIIGGFCPGTTFTAIAIGKKDALFFFIGIFIGIFLFGEGFPLYDKFYASGYMGNATIEDVLGISAQWFTVIMTVVALASFWVTAEIEKKVRKNRKEYKF